MSGAGILGERQERLGLWLQIPRQVTEDEHQHPDRVRLPRSLFESLQGSKPTVRLAITILDIGPGTLFKVRRGLMGTQGGSEVRSSVRQAMLALSGIVTVEPDGEGGDDKPLDNVPAAARSHPTPRGLGSANRRLMLVIHVPLFGPPPPSMPLDLYVYPK